MGLASHSCSLGCIATRLSAVSCMWLRSGWVQGKPPTLRTASKSALSYFDCLGWISVLRTEYLKVLKVYYRLYMKHFKRHLNSLPSPGSFDPRALPSWLKVHQVQWLSGPSQEPRLKTSFFFSNLERCSGTCPKVIASADARNIWVLA